MATSSPPEEAAETAPRRGRSLRLRILAVAAATLVATLSIGGLALSDMFENSIEQTIEQQLDVYWSELAAAFVVADGEPRVTREMSDPRFHTPFAGAYWRIDEDGHPVLRSRSLWDQDLVPDPRRHLSPRGLAEEMIGPEGTTVYVAGRQVVLGSGETERTFTLSVGLDTRDVRELRAKFGGDLVRSLGLIGLLLFGGAVVQASFGLAPLGLLRRRLAAVHGGTARRLDGAFPWEVAPLVDDMNTLLARQEDLVRRARARAGDLAHGLKTPLTVLTGLERRRREAGDTESADLLAGQIAAMRAHVERELSRARTHGVAAAAGTLTDARTTVERLIGLVERAPRGGDLVWNDALPDDLRLRIDADDFGEIIGNLLDNARKAARTTVRVGCEGEAEAMRIVVDDDGPGIPPDRIPQLLARGHSEDATAEGSGLGLAIVTDLATEYAMRLDLGPSPLGGCRASIGPFAANRAAPAAGDDA